MEESDDDTLLRLAFEIDKTLLERGTITSPQDGLQFLANVVLERRNCREVVTVPPPDNSTKQNIFATEPPKLLTAHESLIPTLEWQNYQVADFSDLRTHISKINNQRSVWTHSIKYPSIDGKKAHTLWKEFIKSNEPLLSLIFTMKQFILEYVLEFLIDSLDEIPEGESISVSTGKWIFAVLAALKLPLTPDACSLIRDLARTCSQIRNKLSTEDEDISKKVAPLNLFICLTAHYFRQIDLMDK